MLHIPLCPLFYECMRPRAHPEPIRCLARYPSRTPLYPSFSPTFFPHSFATILIIYFRVPCLTCLIPVLLTTVQSPSVPLTSSPFHFFHFFHSSPSYMIIRKMVDIGTNRRPRGPSQVPPRARTRSPRLSPALLHRRPSGLHQTYRLRRADRVNVLHYPALLSAPHTYVLCVCVCVSVYVCVRLPSFISFFLFFTNEIYMQREQ